MSETRDVAADDVASTIRNLCYANPHFADRYEGFEEIGQSGNNTVVVKVIGKLEKAPLALKILLNVHKETRAWFAREAITSRAVASPYVVRVASAFAEGPVAWLEMEWVDGTDLEREIDRRARENEPYSVPECLEIATAVCHGLAAAHAVGVIHRDIKPANILLPRSRSPVAKITDFGIAKPIDSPGLTQIGEFRGTPFYASPEAFGDHPVLTSASDVFSLGLCLFFLFGTHQHAYAEIDEKATSRKIATILQRGTPRMLRSVRRDVPESVEALAAQCLEVKDPTARPTAAALAVEFERIRAALVAPVPSEPRKKGRTRQVLLVSLGVVAGVVLCVVSLVVGLLWLAGHSGSSRQPAVPTPTAATSPTVASTIVPTALPESVATVHIEGGFVTVTAGAREISGELAVITATRPHTHKIEKMAPGDVAWISLAELSPPLPAAEKAREVQLTVITDGRTTTYATTP